jgi:hypothetical protein
LELGKLNLLLGDPLTELHHHAGAHLRTDHLHGFLAQRRTCRDYGSHDGSRRYREDSKRSRNFTKALHNESPKDRRGFLTVTIRAMQRQFAPNSLNILLNS